MIPSASRLKTNDYDSWSLDNFSGVGVVCAAAAALIIGEEIKNPITRAETIEVTNTVILICIRPSDVITGFLL
jgi:hypothetical protein